jgi:small conductance mechanosensitive channel
MFLGLQAGGWQRQLAAVGAALVENAPRVGFRVFLTLLLYAIARWAAGKVIDTLLASIIARSGPGREGQAARLRTLQGLLKSVAGYLLAFIAGATILDALGLNIGALLAGAGVAGMAIGFGAQRLVRDVITGFFILMEDQYSVGDRVTIGAFSGEVLEIGMRITRLRDDSGKLVILANGDISSVINHSRGPLVASVEVSLPRETDLEALAARLQSQPLDREKSPFLEPPTLRGLAALEGDTITVRFTAPAREGRQAEAEMALRERVREAMGEASQSSSSSSSSS